MTEQNRRGLSAAGSAGGDAAGLAIHSRGRRRHTGRRFAVPPSAFINGGGCAAAVINQWKRLRRSEYLGGPEGRFQHGQTVCNCQPFCPLFLSRGRSEE